MGMRREREGRNKVDEEINSDDMKNSDESCNGMEWNINGWEVLLFLLLFPHERTHSQGITTCDHLLILSLSLFPSKDRMHLPSHFPFSTLHPSFSSTFLFFYSEKHFERGKQNEMSSVSLRFFDE